MENKPKKNIVTFYDVDEDLLKRLNKEEAIQVALKMTAQENRDKQFKMLEKVLKEKGIVLQKRRTIVNLRNAQHIFIHVTEKKS
jgi:hypothetical protein